MDLAAHPSLCQLLTGQWTCCHLWCTVMLMLCIPNDVRYSELNKLYVHLKINQILQMLLCRLCSTSYYLLACICETNQPSLWHHSTSVQKWNSSCFLYPYYRSKFLYDRREISRRCSICYLACYILWQLKWYCLKAYFLDLYWLWKLGQTALHRAAWKDSTQMAELLLYHKAKLEVKEAVSDHIVAQHDLLNWSMLICNLLVALSSFLFPFPSISRQDMLLSSGIDFFPFGTEFQLVGASPIYKCQEVRKSSCNQ